MGGGVESVGCGLHGATDFRGSPVWHQISNFCVTLGLKARIFDPGNKPDKATLFATLGFAKPITPGFWQLPSTWYTLYEQVGTV